MLYQNDCPLPGPTRELITPYTAEAGGPINWICMDDRPLAEPLRDMPYRQIGGGVHGAATDHLVVTEMHRRGTFLDTSAGSYTAKRSKPENTVPELAQKDHMILLGSGVFAILHEGCAAEGSAPEISTAIANLDMGTLYNRTLEFDPGADESTFGHTVDIHRAMAAQEVFRGSPNGITRLPLVKVPHIARRVLANHLPHTRFQTNQAEFNNPDRQHVYHVSFGDFPELFEPLLGHQEIPFDPQQVRTASAVRHAAISLRLPNQPLVVDYIPPEAC